MERKVKIRLHFCPESANISDCADIRIWMRFRSREQVLDEKNNTGRI
jgi:hypothetical protein